jgi:hypothetical protein
MKLDALESVVDANWGPYILAKDALEKLKDHYGPGWPEYVKQRWNNLKTGYTPRIQSRDEAKRESIWELQQRLSAAEREEQRLADKCRPIGNYGDPRGTDEERAELARLKKLIKDLNRRILNHGN